LEVLNNYTGSEVSSHWGANTVWIHLSHFFILSLFPVSVSLILD